MGANGIDLVIFDCDGVLVDSEVLASRLLAEALGRQGYAITPEQSRARFTGMSIRSVIDAIEAETGRPLPADFEDALRARDLAVFSRELKAVPGVAAALKRIGIPKCVASSGVPEKIRHSLAVTGLLAHFEPHLFSARMVANGKPAPDLFLLAARRMGAAPARAVVIEDSAAGVRAAKAAGMQCLGFAGAGHAGPGHAGMLADAGADRIFERMADLPGLLGFQDAASGWSATAS